jgi:hypothetical protein
MTPHDVVGSLVARYPGLVPQASWGETSLFYNPGLVLTRGVYFCTIKDHDGAHDRASHLDRPGVFRVALGVPEQRYEALFGARPSRPPKGGVAATGHDFTATNVLMPHPVYAWMGWVQILSPSSEMFEELQPLFAEAHQRAATTFDKRVVQGATTGPQSTASRVKPVKSWRNALPAASNDPAGPSK